MKLFSPRLLFAFLALACLSYTKGYAQYCTPTYFQGCTFSGHINNFTLNGVASTSISDLSTGCTSTPSSIPLAFDAYLDHSSMSVSLNAGATYTITATTALGIPPTPSNVQIFIDFNNNFSFTDAGETVGGGVFNIIGSTNFAISIPASAPAGAHRLRMVSITDETYPSINPCPTPPTTGGTATTGETHDYTVNIISSTPACPPVTGLAVSAITSSSASVSWTAATGATGYEWAVTTSSTPPASGTYTTLTTVTASPLTASTAYYAHVRTQCGSTFSSWVTSPVFNTLAAPTTCNPVTGITMSGITAGGATLNWTAVSGAIGYEWAVTTSATPPASGTLTTLTTATASGLTASTTYYSHVRTKCSATLFSSWTTQTFTTTAASTCPAITGLSASAITTSSATVSWTAVSSGSLGYQYVINTTVTDPVGSGTNTTATSTNPTGLTAATTYYAHVRDSCSTTSFSPWSTIPFTTLAAPGGCNAVTALAVSGITATAANLSWTMASGAVGAKWVVDNSPTDPTVFGTLSTTSTAAVSSLTASTSYYAHVRDTCGPGSVSAWVTVPFTTPTGTTGITNINSGSAPFSVAAYPNPATSELTLQVGGTISNSALLSLTDITGKLVRQMAITNSTTAIDVSTLAPGIYIIRYSDAGHVQTLKISKQ